VDERVVVLELEHKVVKLVERYAPMMMMKMKMPSMMCRRMMMVMIHPEEI
jgi:hypothetical protein